MPVAIAVALGGALGSWLRYVISIEVTRRVEVGAGTFAVNILGTLILGLVVGLMETRFPDAPRWVIGGLGIGILGGFTTFSTYMLDVVHHLEGGRAAIAVLYLSSTIAIGIAAAFLGVWVGRQAG